MRFPVPVLICFSLLGTAGEVPLTVGQPEPKDLDLRSADLRALLPVDARDPAQVERAQEAMKDLVAAFRQQPAVRLLLPRTENRERLLLAASQALKAQNPAQLVYLAFDPGMAGFWNEMAWGALDGGALLPTDLGLDPTKWEPCLTRAQELLPGRPWTLWLPQDPGPLTGTLLGDGGHLVVPPGGPAALLASQLPAGFTGVEGGRGDLTLRHPGTGELRRWRFELGAWKPAESPRERHEVAVLAKDAYDVGALLARLRATSLRDRSALRDLEATLDVDLHIQDFSGPGTDVGYRYRLFQKAGEPDEMIQKEVLFNGVRANLKGQANLPFIEAKTSSALPVALALTERYRYEDGGPGPRPGTRWLTFIPADGDPTLYAGQLLVDEASGRIFEERSHREGLPGMVKSESRTLSYGEPAPGLWTLMSLESYDRWYLFNDAILVKRRMTLKDFIPNSGDFETSRTGARNSQSAMMVQTTEGLRYYTRQPDGSRLVDERSRTAGRAMGAYLLSEPASGMPIAPLALFTFYDFDAWGKGIQYNLTTVLVVNQGSISVPNLFWGCDAQATGVLSFIKDTDRPVRDGKLLDSEGVGRRTQVAGIALGRDLGKGFRLSLQSDLAWNHYSLAPEKEYRSPDYVLPPSGLDHRLTGGLGWQGSGVILQGSYGVGHRPEGQYGLPVALQTVPNQGDYRQWQGLTGYNLDLGQGHWLDFGLGQQGGSGFDRFKSLDVSGMGSDALAPGLRSNAIAADRVNFGRISYVLPTGPNLRLTFKLGSVLMRSLEDHKTYSFTGLGIAGDLPGFGWFTTTRIDLGVGLQSQIQGVRTVNGTLSLLRVF